MNTETERERLSQRETLQDLLRPIRITEMVTVYSTTRASDGGHHGIYCALIPSEQIEQVLSHSSWDLSHGQGLPSSTGLGGVNAEYLRFGNSDGIEPLVIDRAFYTRNGYDSVELCEEFRFFHNLYHDRQQETYTKFDDNGDETVVAEVKPELVKIRMKEIRQFLAIKEMHLSVQFDCAAYSRQSLDELGLTSSGQDMRQDLSYWNFSYYSDGRRGCSTLQGKRLIPPLPKSKSGFEGFAEKSEDQYMDFIIGMDDDGDEILHTCDPAALSNWFGKNPGAPHEVTPVSFRKEVLEEYYRQPSRYKVDDGTLWCRSAWYLRIDNHHEDKVCVLLKDLGDLPYQEQLHWRKYNIAAESGYSETAWRRYFENEWVDSDRPEHAFQDKYRRLTEACQENLGWDLLLPLSSGDEYHLQNIRVPATDEQQEFDGLVLGLATILVDSINEKSLKTLIPKDQHTGKDGKPLRGIQLLNNVLTVCQSGQPDEHIAFLRNLQNLRSSGSAHRKGREYRKAAAQFGVESQDLRTVFTGILWQAVSLLDYLIDLVESQQIPASADAPHRS